MELRLPLLEVELETLSSSVSGSADHLALGLELMYQLVLMTTDGINACTCSICLMYIYNYVALWLHVIMENVIVVQNTVWFHFIFPKLRNDFNSLSDVGLNLLQIMCN